MNPLSPTLKRKLEQPSTLGKVYRTDEEMLADLVALKTITPGPLTVKEARQARKEGIDIASAATYVTRFGSWNEALIAAGLQGKPPRGGKKPEWSPEACAMKVATMAKELDRLPTATEYIERQQTSAIKGHWPSASTVKLMCGSWLNALIMAEGLLRHSNRSMSTRA